MRIDPGDTCVPEQFLMDKQRGPVGRATLLGQIIHPDPHGGEDVAIFATGVDSYLVHGTMEENWIYFVMADAMKLGK